MTLAISLIIAGMALLLAAVGCYIVTLKRKLANARGVLITLTEIANVTLYTNDHVRPQAAMTVYAISPYCELETLYVEDTLCRASTIFPSTEDGYCVYPITQCFACKGLCEAIIEQGQYDGD